MRKITAPIFLALLLFPDLSFSQNVRQRLNIDEGWTFHLGHAADAKQDFNYSIENIFSKSGKAEITPISAKFNDSDWYEINLPHDWAVELPFEKSDNVDVMAHGYKPVGGLYPQNSIGWYRKKLMINKSDSDNRFSIQFDGIFRDAKFWINGFYLGNNASGYIGETYDITDYLRYGEENILVVRVDASQYEGWFYEGAGIYRHVWLNRFSNLHIIKDDLFLHTKSQAGSAVVNIDIPVFNKNFSPVQATIYSYVTDRGGTRVSEIAEQTINVSSDDAGISHQKLIVKNPKLWSIEEPYLYRLVTVIKVKGRSVDSCTTKFGIREIEIKPNGVFLNGKYVKIKGVNCHQDHAGVGTALPDYLQYYRIGLLKQMGANAYRTSHNAPTPELLEACDSLGMLVMDEQRLLNSSPEYISQFERLIKRDRNHPSIFLWSIGNEEGWIHITPTGKRIALSLLSKQKQLDPTRTSTYAADVANVYQGVNEVIPVRGFNYRQFAVADYHRDHPNQPIIGTEMGSTVTTRGVYKKDTVRGYVPDQDITAPWWASTAETWWKLAADNPAWLGGFIWTGFDYKGEPTPYQWPNINSHFGVMDMCGFPKNIYYYYQSWWTDKDVLHISPHWNWDDQGMEGKPIDVWVNSNADEVELFLNGKSQGSKIMPRNGHLQWQVNYARGTLEAIAIKKGRILKAKVQTTSPAFMVKVTPYKTTMLADGKDATVINITAVDKEDREVPAAALIEFKVTGDAKIIGVGNGNPSNHDPEKQGDSYSFWLFNGKCQVILQSGKHPGIIKFEATSRGLWKGDTDIHTIAASGKSSGTINSLPGPRKKIAKMVGADVSFLPELEAKHLPFRDNGVERDPLVVLKEHGFNYIRLRIFNNPAADSGYSPGKGFCDLEHTKQMAKRVKALGMKLLLDFHYSDTWADPGKQFKPAAWKNLNFAQLKDSVREFTTMVIKALKAQGTLPDMVQIGNEINHGILWPEGQIGNTDNLAELLKAGIAGVNDVSQSIPIMIHIALGGQHDESVWFLDNMIARGVKFDVIGQSYYPRWHGTLADLETNLTALAKRYPQDIILVEYSYLKKEVNNIVVNLPDGKGKGSAIWEPLNTWEAVYDRVGQTNDLLLLYDEISKWYR